MVNGGVKIRGTNKLSFTNTSDQTFIRAASSNVLAFGTNSTDRMHLLSTGALVVGGTSDSAAGSVTLQGDGDIRSVLSAGAGGDTIISAISGVSNGYQITATAGNVQTYKWHTGGTNSMTLDSSGNLLVGKTSAGDYVTGFEVQPAGAVLAYRTNGVASIFGRTNDGEITRFTRAGSIVGNITVSGGTVSYNPFMGSHYSETNDIDLLFGTVMEATGNLVEDKYASQVRLSKTKISDVSESPAVYGVWIAPMEHGGETIAAVGASWCRVSGSETVAVGDLLTSNGDGTAKVQSDDIIRSKTIGKVTSTTIKQTHADGSYVVPVVLYCG